MAGWISPRIMRQQQNLLHGHALGTQEGRAFSLFAAIVMPLSLMIAWLIYAYVLGDPGNFVGGDPEKEPLQGNYLGTIHKGGPIVVPADRLPGGAGGLHRGTLPEHPAGRRARRQPRFRVGVRDLDRGGRDG